MNSRLFDAFDCDAVQPRTSEDVASVDTDVLACMVSVCPVRLVLQEQHSEANFGRVGWALQHTTGKCILVRDFLKRDASVRNNANG